MTANVDLLLEKARSARLNAYAPYSKFLVGACIETVAGNLYAGCNVENASYGLTSCAEASAISAMISAGEKHISQILIVTEGPGVCGPCGACRQRIYEFATKGIKIHCCDLNGGIETKSMETLLPAAFGPHNLS